MTRWIERVKIAPCLNDRTVDLSVLLLLLLMAATLLG